MSIQSVHRALTILSFFSAARPRLGVTELGRLMGLSKTTVHNLVKTLVGHGFLQQDHETRKYSLGLKIYELGTTLAGSLPLNQVGAQPAERLTAATGLMSRLAVWDCDTVLVTLNFFPLAEAPWQMQLGPRVPAYCTALGKAVLAFMDAVRLAEYLDSHPLAKYTTNTITDHKVLRKELDASRQRGYAVDRGEYVDGFTCLGAPIFDYSGLAVGAVSLSGRPEDVQGDQEAKVGLELIRTAREISRRMGFRPEMSGR
jgi:DNA-binding IclR family transcriptional regulator